MLTIDQIAGRCEKVRWSGKASFTALCKGHDDRNPSMSVSESQDGTILAHCHAGCDQQSVLEALGIWQADKKDRWIAPVIPIKTRPCVDTSGTEARAERVVKLSTPAPDNHPYLVRKGIQPHGIGVLGPIYKDLPSNVRNQGNVLVVPMQDVHGKILSCQFIAEDGSKSYMAGSKQKGGFYLIKGNDRLWICEGFATGASLHEDTGDTVACAFDTGGLMPVTGALRALYGSSRETFIMADDDWETDGNPGLTKAQSAARANGIKALMPDFGGLGRGAKDTDYNDYKRLTNEQ